MQHMGIPGLLLIHPVFIVIDIVIIVFILTVGDCDYPTKTVTITCNPWQPPPGGNDCDKCNSLEGTNLINVRGDLATNCNEYKCRSLGKACEFIPGANACIETSPNDFSGPQISPHEEVLTEQGLNFDLDTNGYTINGELPAFTPITLAIKTDKFSTCLYEDHTVDSIEEMANPFGSIIPSQEHSLEITHPPSSPDNPTETTYYLMCQDLHGNPSNQYAITFTTQKAQDLSSPLITAINTENTFLRFNQDSVEVTLLVLDSSKVDCKYSTTSGKRYDAMEGDLFCTNTRPNDRHYFCSNTLIGLTPGENKFYFKCKDQSPSQLESQEEDFILIRSTELTVVATDTTPSGKINNNDIAIVVKTFGGAEDGKAICSYSINGRFIDVMKNTGGSIHSQSQHLTNGDYRYDISCEDIAGNQVRTTIDFTVDLGTAGSTISPRLIHTYKESSLFIILNKQTNCEYNNQQFTFGNGIPMTETDSTIHSAPLEFSKYFIRCQDISSNNLEPIEIIP